MSSPSASEIQISEEISTIVSEWLTVLRSLPDPAPEPFASELRDAAIIVAISTLAESLSPRAQGEVKAALAPVVRKSLRAKRA